MIEMLMASVDPNPTVSRLKLAAHLRELRFQAGKSIDEAATELVCSVAKISRMEAGGRGVQPRDVRDLCRLYGVPNNVRDDLTRLAEEARAAGWWRDFRTLDEQIATFIDLESAASSSRLFEVTRVPGLLQTPAFTRALIGNLRPPPGAFTGQWIDETVAVRERRQKRVESGELEFHAILDEAALSRPVGSPTVMRHQIARLIDEATRANVHLQVIPFEHGPHPGMDGSFQYLSFERHRIDDMVYVEGLLGNYLLSKGDEVAHYRVVFDDLSTRHALDADATHRWLKALHGRLRPVGSD